MIYCLSAVYWLCINSSSKGGLTCAWFLFCRPRKEVSFLLEAGGVYAVAALTYNYIGEKQVNHISCFAEFVCSEHKFCLI